MAYYNDNKNFLIALKGDGVFIRYSSNADGTDFTETRSEGQNYIGFAEGQMPPTDKAAYSWFYINNVTVSQTKGDNTYNVMSQKAVTDELTRIDGNISTVSDRVSILEKVNEGNTYAFVTDDSVAYEKYIPHNSLGHVLIDKMGGMSVNSEWFETQKSFGNLSNPVGDLSITVDANGVFTVNGELKSNGSSFFNMSFGLNEGQDTVDSLLTVIGGSISGDARVFLGDSISLGHAVTQNLTATQGEYIATHTNLTYVTVPFDCIVIMNDSASTVVFNDYKFKFNLGFHRSQIKHTPVTAITVKGKNLIPDDVKDKNNWTKDGSSYDYTLDLPNGWYAMSAKLHDTSNLGYLYLQVSTDGGLTYSSASTTGYAVNGASSVGLFINDAGLKFAPFWFEVKDGVKYRLHLAHAQLSMLDKIYDWQIERVNMLQTPSTSYPPSTNAPVTDYTPPSETSYPIPQSVQQLEGYGFGVSAEHCNYVDFEEQNFVQNCIVTHLYGTETWNEFATGIFNSKLQRSAVGSSTVVSSKHKFTVSQNGEWLIAHTEYTTLAEWVNHLKACAAEGTPITIVQTLLNPEVVNISQHLDFEDVVVLGGGFICFENEIKAPTPNTITYQLKIKV